MSAAFDSFGIDGDEVHAAAAAAPTTGHPQFEDHHHDGGGAFSGYGGYSGFPPGPDGEVAVDRSPEIFGFEDPGPGYSPPPSTYDSVHVENGNGNGSVFEGGDDGGGGLLRGWGFRSLWIVGRGRGFRRRGRRFCFRF